VRLFLDQMLSERLATALRDEGHDVVRTEEVGQQRATDPAVLQHAQQESRTLVTLDEHFGDWLVLPLRSHAGVIRLKVPRTTTERIADLLVPFLRAHRQEEFRNRLVILSAQRVRWIRTAER